MLPYVMEYGTVTFFATTWAMTLGLNFAENKPVMATATAGAICESALCDLTVFLSFARLAKFAEQLKCSELYHRAPTTSTTGERPVLCAGTQRDACLSRYLARHAKSEVMFSRLRVILGI